MRKTPWFAFALFSLVVCGSLFAEDEVSHAKKAVEKATLDQAGTSAFHLKATFAPSFDRDKASNRTGDLEIWWQSPTRWRRELRSPEFHQVQIVDGTQVWQKNDGDYFPEWLRELSVAIVRPIPLPMDTLLLRLKTAEVRHIADQTNLDWPATGDAGDVRINGKGYLALIDKTGLLFYTGGEGFGGLYHDFENFHGRSIARTVASGRIEVTAKITLLEDLGARPAGFFDASAPGSDPVIDTVQLDEATLSKSLQPSAPVPWPSLTDGPLEGLAWTEVVLDRTGAIRQIERSIADNPGVNDTADQAFRAMHFRPILRDGVPVQAAGRVSLRFKTTRPAGVEAFSSAREYFEHGRKASFLGAGATTPYTLRAEFQTGTTHGVDKGRYVDTWISPTQWRREAWIGSSHFARAQVGEKHYLLAEGPEAGILRLVLLALEPIPASDTMTESDWRIRRDGVDAVKAIRVFRGPEGPKGELDPASSQGYWFDEKGHLLKSYANGLEILPQAMEEHDGVQVEQRIGVFKDHKLGMAITVQEIVPADAASVKTLPLKGHEWQRAFTAETR